MPVRAQLRLFTTSEGPRSFCEAGWLLEGGGFFQGLLGGAGPDRVLSGLCWPALRIASWTGRGAALGGWSEQGEAITQAGGGCSKICYHCCPCVVGAWWTTSRGGISKRSS